jgi:hypothetical protein
VRSINGFFWQQEVAGNPKRSILWKLKTCDGGFCACVAREMGETIGGAK